MKTYVIHKIKNVLNIGVLKITPNGFGALFSFKNNLTKILWKEKN